MMWKDVTKYSLPSSRIIIEEKAVNWETLKRGKPSAKTKYGAVTANSIRILISFGCDIIIM